MIVHLQSPSGSQTASVGADEISGGGAFTGSSIQFQVRDDKGVETTEQLAGRGITIRSLVDSVSSELHVSPDAVEQANIPRPNGRGDVIIRRPGLGVAGANGYEDRKSPTFIIDGTPQVMSFFRPLKANDPDDQNYLDYFQVEPSPNLDLYLSTSAAELTPTIQVSPAEPQVDKPVSFSVTGVEGHGDLTYLWTIDGTPMPNGQSTVSAPTHTWSKDGGYEVAVSVVAADLSAGTATTTVQVGKKPKPDGHNPPGPGGGGPNNTGPTHGFGGQNGDPDGQPGDGSNGDPGAGEGAGPNGPGEQEQPGTPGRSDREEAPLGADGGSVSGILLTAASAPVTSSEDPAPVAAASARRTPEPQRDPIVYAAIAVPLLLLAGALSEYRLAVAAAVAGTTRRLRRRKEKPMGKTE